MYTSHRGWKQDGKARQGKASPVQTTATPSKVTKYIQAHFSGKKYVFEGVL
jgi:hypothetical protein